MNSPQSQLALIDEHSRAYHGFLTLMNQEYEVWIQLPTHSRSNSSNDNQCPSGAIFGSEKLLTLLRNQTGQLSKKLAGATDIDGFIIDLLEMMENTRLTTGTVDANAAPILEDKHGGSTKDLKVFWSRVVEELDSVGWDRLQNIEPDFSKLEVKLWDRAERQHIATVHFPPDFPTVPLRVDSLQLPQTNAGVDAVPQLKLKVQGPGTTLQKRIWDFEKALEDYQEFWRVMDDIDSHTWVIDPEKPTRVDKMRRCAMGNHCSVQVTIDPGDPFAVPEIRLFGPEALVSQMRTKLHDNLAQWDETCLPRENLAKALELPNGFITPETASAEDTSVECGICYSFRFEGSVPDQICSYAKCQRAFHRVCLYEWLRAVPTTRQSFHTLFGVCPYCNEAITTSMPRL